MLTQFIENLLSFNTSIDVISICASLAAGFVLGLIIFIIYKLTAKEYEFDSGFGLALIIMTMMSSVIICASRSYIAASILTLIGYKAYSKSSKNIAFIFLSMGIGFISGIGFYIPAVIITVLAGLVIVIYSLFSLSNKKSQKKTLKIAVPEDICYDGIFDDVLKKYTTTYSLKSIEMTNCGTVTELTYDIRIKDPAQSKAFIDDLRVLNANFRIQLTEGYLK